LRNFSSLSLSTPSHSAHSQIIPRRPTKKQPHFCVLLENHSTLVQFCSVRTTPLSVVEPHPRLKTAGPLRPWGIDCYSPCHCFNFHVDLVVFVLMTSPQQQPQKWSKSINTGNHYGVSYFYCIFYKNPNSLQQWNRGSNFRISVAAIQLSFMTAVDQKWRLKNIYPQQWEKRGVAFDSELENSPYAIELSSWFSAFLCNCHLLSGRMFGIFCKLYSPTDLYLIRPFA